MKISYLGPKNTYSEQAASAVAKNIPDETELSPIVSLDGVARCVAEGGADLGVMAYYNFLEGLVQECVDLIYENDLRIIGAQRVPIILAAGKYPGCVDLSCVYSHPKALAQSSEWLLSNFPGSRQVSMTSTAAAVERVVENGSGLAIASRNAIEKGGLELLSKDVGNVKHGKRNFTDFYTVSRESDVSYDPDAEYLTMVAVTPQVDKVGLLWDILGQVAFHGLNNAKIHSRPAIDHVDMESEPQMFYLEIRCHKKSPDFKRCVDSLKYKLVPRGKDVEVVRVLGSYNRPRA